MILFQINHEALCGDSIKVLFYIGLLVHKIFVNVNNSLMITRFLIYGLFGWFLEVIWTGFLSAISRNPKLTCTTYIWMFPIYGLAVLFEPLVNLLSPLPILLRGVIYVGCIFTVEYATGFGIKAVAGVSPWDYSNSRYNVNGLIRWDYAPIWFIAALGFERLYFVLKNGIYLSF